MTIFEGISIGISVFSLGFSIYVFFRNRLYSAASQESSIYSHIVRAKADLSLAEENASAFESDRSSLGARIHRNLVDARIELIRTYEFAGQHYFSGVIDKDRFDQLYSSEILGLWSDPVYVDILQQGYYPSLVALRQKYEKQVLKNE